MKKMVKMMLVFTVVLSVLTGCSNPTWVLTINDDGHYSVVSSPDARVMNGHFGWNEVENTADFSVKNDGEYPFVVKDEEGKEYTIRIIRKDGEVEVKADDGISVELKEK